MVLAFRKAVASFLLLFSVMVCQSALAGEDGETALLTVSGHIAGDKITLNRAQLEAMPVTEFSTTTVWTDGNVRFQGVLLKDLLEYVGAGGSRLNAIALNDYAVEIPVSDAVAGGPIVAFKMNGEAMSVRDKGPLWIVYPFDSDAGYQTKTIYARSIWQLNRIEVQM